MGLCGTVHPADSQSVLSDIGSVCIRIAGEWPGTANHLLSCMNGATSILLIGAPGSGKTTLLRDLARQLGNSHSALQIAIVDERSEIAACVNGVPQLDVGVSTDVLDNLSKTEAIPWLIRSMSPQLIITDELGSVEDATAVLDASACGVRVCASVHGTSLQEAATRPPLAALMARRLFDLYAVLSPEGGGHIAAMYDRTGSPLHST